MKRKIIEINEDKCDGCGNCVPNCPEGALQIIDGKARLVSDLLCDGLGACLGECPKGAITTIEREAEKYDEKKVMKNIAKKGVNTIKAHLEHLRNHGQTTFLKQALEYLKENNMKNPIESNEKEKLACGCPGTMAQEFKKEREQIESVGSDSPRKSELTHWPVQLHLISPTAPYFDNKDLLIAADCTAFALGDFHSKFLKNKSLVIACPKLDSGTEIYIDKIRALIDDAKVNTITAVIMEVPCCGGLISLIKEALSGAKRKVPVKKTVISMRGEILSEEWL